MNARNIQVGTSLKFEFIGSTGNKASDTYTSEFVQILDDYEVAIISPLHRLKLMFVPSDARIKGSFIHPEHGQFTFTGNITKKVLETEPQLIHIKIDESCLKIQKRKYYRTEHFFNARYRVLQGVGSEEEPDAPCQNAITRNISYRGVCLLTKRDIDESAIIDLDISLPMSMNIRMKCEIVRKTKLKRRYELGLHIIEISRQDRESLRRFITVNTIIAR